MDVVWEVIGFAGKGLVVAIVFAACSAIVFSRIRGRDRGVPGHLEVTRINERLLAEAEALRGAMLPAKERRKHHRQLVKQAKQPPVHDKNVYVIDFKGDILASAVDSLRAEINALSVVGRAGDEVVVRLESPGGAAHSYGLAASQLARLRAKGFSLTVCVDKVAASGGYMMACVADKIIAAPFAVLGSIGVVAAVPNVHRLLDRIGVDYENVTGGKYKRTVSAFAPITEEGRRKFQEQIDELHGVFKDWVSSNRPELDIDKVATGEHWPGQRAHALGLVNELMTSDDYLLSKLDSANIYKLRYHRRRQLSERVAGVVRAATDGALGVLASRLDPERIG